MPKEATQFKPKPNSLASEILAVRVEKQIDGVVRALPNRTEWLRRVITEAAKRELMGDISEAAKRKRDDQSFAEIGGDVDASN